MLFFAPNFKLAFVHELLIRYVHWLEIEDDA